MIKAKNNGTRRFFWKFSYIIKRGWELGYLKVLVLLLIITGLLLFKHWANLDNTLAWKKDNPGFIWAIVDFITDSNAVAVFTSALIGVIIWQISLMISSFTEERRKTTQDHHAVIRHYSGYAPKSLVDGENEKFNASECLMKLTAVNRPISKKENDKLPYPTNRILIKQSPGFFQQEKANEVFMAEGKLFLPSINFFTNKDHDVTPVFADSSTPYELPELVSGNLTAIFAAHSHSVTRNSETVRLDDAQYKPETKTLELTTSRTTYYDMLMTNRCMDFDIGNGMTLRNLYEYRNRVSSFKDSVLANQIGINGLIITKDGWLLLEKRSRKKSTWKGKYAQPISLSMQVSKLGFLPGQKTIASGLESSKDVVSHLIRHTIRDNYGLIVKNYDDLKKERLEKERKAAPDKVIEETKIDTKFYEGYEHYYFDGTVHFLGLARDLLEGGKPNLYYYVILDLDHEALAEHLRSLKTRKDPIPVESEMKANKDAYTSKICLPFEKFQSGYVIAPYDSIVVDMDYKLSFRKNKNAKIKTVRPAYHLHLSHRKRGCGEALLVCLSYLEEMGGVEALIKKEKSIHRDIFESVNEDEVKEKKDPA